MAGLTRHKITFTHDELSIALRNKLDALWEQGIRNPVNAQGKRQLVIDIMISEPDPIKAREILLDLFKRKT